MRLSPDHAQAIVAAACAVMGPEVRVKRFGSPLDDSARDGDIDGVVELPHAVDQPMHQAVLRDGVLLT